MGIKAVIFEICKPVFTKRHPGRPSSADLGTGTPKNGKNGHFQVSNRRFNQWIYVRAAIKNIAFGCCNHP
jgi:hypothetical protein